MFVRNGYGQSRGGYLLIGQKNRCTFNGLSQKDHFLSYYENPARVDKLPTYSYLRCPQLLLYIAELVGVPEKTINDACQIIMEYEQRNELRCSEKNGNYIWGKAEFAKFKTTLRIGVISKIIQNESNFCDIQEKVLQLFD